jgi:ribonucleoside-diphosphate reductase subunit M2
MIENVHSEVYSNLIDCYISDPIEKDKVLHASKNFPSVAKMSDWALKWANSSNPFNQRILAYTCVEALFFSGPFCSIYWLKKRGLMPGLTHSNELISRDEGLHMDFGVLIHHLLKYPASNQTVRDIITDSVDLCREFICESLPCALIGMNSGEMSQYIEYIADRLMIKLTGETIYNVSNPFVGWMEMISIDAKTNFFEKKVSEYVKSGTNFDLLKSNGYQTTDNTNHTTNVFEDF